MAPWLTMLLGAAVLVTVVAPTGSSALGLVVTGVGTGTSVSPQGFVFCENAPFSVRAVFLPDDKGVLEFTWTSWNLECLNHDVANGGFLTLGGGRAHLGTLYYDLGQTPPTLRWEFRCDGNEAVGLVCDAGQGLVTHMGAYQGLGSRVWLTHTGSELFAGSFIAV